MVSADPLDGVSLFPAGRIGPAGVSDPDAWTPLPRARTAAHVRVSAGAGDAAAALARGGTV